MALLKEEPKSAEPTGKTVTRELPTNAAMNEVREMVAGIEARQLNNDEKDCLSAVVRCYGSCYAVQAYGWYVDGAITPEIRAAVYDCMDCCQAFMSLMYRESALASDAAELCVAGADACSAVCSASTDPVILACGTACKTAAAACTGMADAGEAAEEGRSGHAMERLEQRNFRPEIRAAGEQGKPTKITGYPILFNQDSLPMDSRRGQFVERILPGSVQFDPDVRADFNHDSNCILGRVANGTLSLTVDDRGVRMEAEPPDTQWARDLMTSIGRGDIDQGSFAFRILPDGETWTEESGRSIRSLSKILVRRVSVVSDPAYPATRMQLRSNNGIPATPETSQSADPTAGLAAPPATTSGGVGYDHLRRRLDLADREI